MKNRLISILTAALIIGFGGFDIVAMSKKFPLTITAEAKNQIAEIRISGVIHEYQNSAQSFKQQIDQLLAQGIQDVKLYINTPGGSVFEANEIANEIKRFSGTISGFGGALVASAGSYLALMCDTFELAENGQYMYHKPMARFEGNEDKITADLKLLQNATNQYRTAYSQKTGLSEDEIESRWSKGDVWLSAKEAKDQKFITSVSTRKEKITEDQQALFVACGVPNIPNLKSQKDEKMKNRIMTMLAAASIAHTLTATSSDDDFEKTLDSVLAKAKRCETAESELKTFKTANAKILIDQAVTDGKLNASEKEQWLTNAIDYPEMTAMALSRMVGKPDLNAGVNRDNKEVITGAHESLKNRADWTFDKWQTEDPKGLAKLEDEAPADFEKLFNAKFN